jgi:signal transduction histidine kinase/CheY-like chemotaxis protein
LHTLYTEEYSRELFNAFDQGFCTIEVLFDRDGTPSDYRFVEVNAAFVHQTGLHDVVGCRMRDLAPAHEAHWFEIYGQVALTGLSVRFEHEAAALDRWYDVYAFRVGDPRLHHVAVMFSDISARKRAELGMAAARVEAEKANRAKDEFLAMLGHELRNPLAPMLTALQLLRLRGHHSREQEVLERQVRHLAGMVDDLLDVSRITRGKLDLKCQPIELCPIVVSAMELAGPLLEERRNLVDLDVPQEGAGVNGDPARLAQVVSNLLTNAAKYSEPGSRILVRVGRCGDFVRISVRDEGSGLDPAMIDAVFEPFVQLPQSIERAAGGLGLGLTIVRNIVAAHGGTVRAESKGIGQGTELIVELHAADVTSQPVETAQPTNVSAAGPQKRILIVDDNRDMAEMLRIALEQLGHLVEIAFDGPSALARVQEFRPSTVLLDIGLPVMDGYEVARRLRAGETPAHPMRLLAVTGYGQAEDRRHAREAGFDHHLVKPIDLEELERILAAGMPGAA